MDFNCSEVLLGLPAFRVTGHQSAQEPPAHYGDVDALVRADRALHSKPLSQRYDRGTQQQGQADPKDGVQVEKCIQ
jgi:hypothetical protein